MKNTITIMLSHERSGSHFLSEYISSFKNVTSYDEVCNIGAMVPDESKHSFFNFKSKYLKELDGDVFTPTRQAMDELLLAYFDFLSSERENSNILIDIKYGHVHNFEFFWWPMFQRPFLFDFCERHGVKILHLYRENVVNAVVSGLVAQERKVWHSWQKEFEEKKKQPITLKVNDVVKGAQLLRTQTEWFQNQWIGNAQSHTVTYENASENVGTNNEFCENLAKFVGGELSENYEPRHKKVTAPLAETIVNFDDVREACKQAGLSKFI